jgi:hypothetical protein
METVAVLGASPKPERYSHQAMVLLRKHGHRVIPVNPSHDQIDGLSVARSLTDITEPIDTVTVYVSPAHLDSQLASLISLKPRRVIFNPGAEHPQAMRALQAQGIAVEEACTLVLLRTRQYDQT